MKARVALDLSCLEQCPETGVERYARRLAEFLPRVAPDLQFLLLVRANSPAPVVHPGAELVRIHSRLPRALWREAVLPGDLRRLDVGLLHAPVAAIPLRSGLLRVATIHDVPHLSGVGAESFLSRNRLRLLHAAGAADALVVPSFATKEDLQAAVPRARERIHVIPHGVDPDFRPQGVGLHRERYGILSGPYLLWVGTIRPRKDPMVLIEALARLLKEGEEGLQLVMCGDLRLKREQLQAPLKALGFAKQLCLAGYVHREDLPDLYREASLVVIPSRQEGFGLCALEAMACGKPLVISRDAALRELAGEAGASFKTGDPADLALTIKRLLHDPAECEGRSKVAVAQAASYSWEASARAHADLYRSFLSPSGA